MKSSRGNIKLQQAVSPKSVRVQTEFSKPSTRQPQKTPIQMIKGNELKKKNFDHAIKSSNMNSRKVTSTTLEEGHNDSCQILTEQTQLSINCKVSRNHHNGLEKPNPTTFSNARTVNYVEQDQRKNQSVSSSTVLDSQILKISGWHNEQRIDVAKRLNKNTFSENFSSRNNGPTQTFVNKGETYIKSGISSNFEKQEYYTQNKINGALYGSQSTTRMGSSFQTSQYNRKVDSLKTNEMGTANDDDLISNEASSYSNIDEGEVDISQVQIIKQIPRIISQFVNIFQAQKSAKENFAETNRTLDRILDDAVKSDRAQETNNNMMMSTQACTFMRQTAMATSQSRFPLIESMKKVFEKSQLSPSKVKVARLNKLSCKILPTISVGDITLSDASRSQVISNIDQSLNGNECSVPEIFTNSSQDNDNSIQRSQSIVRSGSIESHGPKMFPVSHREMEGPVITHNSCLHASYNNDDDSSEGGSSQGSILTGGSRSEECQSCGCCRHNMNTSNTLKSSLQNRFMINLETTLLQQTKLFAIGQFFKESKDRMIQEWPSQELMILCEEWWGINKDSRCLFDLYKIYRDSQTRKVLRTAMILQCTLVAFAAFINQIVSPDIFSQDDQSKQRYLKRLIHMFESAHQNLLHIICLVLQRMGLENCDQNVWAVYLKETIKSKIDSSALGSEDVLTLDEAPRCELMQKYNCKIARKIKSMQDLYKRNTQSSGCQPIIFESIDFIVSQIERTHINRAKNILIQALTQETQQHAEINNPYLSQANWQEYPIEDLECDESIQLPISTEQNQQQQYCGELQAIQEEIIEDEYSPYQQQSLDLEQQLSAINEDLTYNNLENSVAPVTIPYLPPLSDQQPKYTLVLDLDETLIHYLEPSEVEDENLAGQFLVRPGALAFLQEMSKYYELVIFTAAMQDYADWVLDQLDVHKCISYRLYRQHAIPGAGQFFIKDLSRLGRDLSKTLIVDNVAENFQLQPDNGVFIRTWLDDPTDNALEELAPLLKEIVVKNIPDVREALRIFRLQMMEQVQRGILKPKLSLDNYYITSPHSINNPEETPQASTPLTVKHQQQFKQITNNVTVEQQQQKRTIGAAKKLF